MQKALSFNDAAIIFVEGNDYKISFWYMSKDEAINLVRKANWIEKKWNRIKHKNLLPRIKCDQRNHKV